MPSRSFEIYVSVFERSAGSVVEEDVIRGGESGAASVYRRIDS
jgi:hypothetical protein